MTLAARAASILGFRVLPTSILVFVAYAAIFTSLTVTDILPNAPALQQQRGLDLKQAYEDLHHIAAKPHPYISHANDNVRAYILSRLTPLAEKYPHVHVANDLSSNASWSSPAGSFGVYFEGTNVLVKVDGTSNVAQGAVLFSAHYDSVATATGATDDGMGVVTLLQLVQYFAEHRSMRTAIFNINNGEEDGLQGAHAFLEHPWSALTETFLNLEGAAAGGRPILFRATTTTPVRSFRNKKFIPHPHANVLSSDAFSRGIIRSSTDFAVYAGPGSRGGMEGLDLAFYKGRSWYHTKYDAVQHTVGGINSLWSMMEAARGAAVGLLNQPFDEKPKDDGDLVKSDDPVYFDLFKSTMVVFQLATLLTFNVVILIAGPTVLVLLFVFKKHFLDDQDKSNDRLVQAEATHSRRSGRSGARASSDDRPVFRYTTRSRTRRGAATEVAATSEESTEPNPLEDDVDVSSSQQNYEVSWAQTIWRHAKFWIALIVAIGMQVLLMWVYITLNPFAIYSSPYVILFSFMSLTYLSMVFVLAFPQIHLHRPKDPSTSSLSHPLHQPAQQQKHTIFFHLYIFTWILLVLATLGITKLDPGLGGGYLVTAWNVCVGAGCVLGAVEGIVMSAVARKGYEGYEELRGSEAEPEPQPTRHSEDVDETTPLIQGAGEGRLGRGARRGGRAQENEEGGAGDLATWWWIPQFLVSVPLPVILLGHVAMLLLDSVPQTLTDGASPWGVYSLTLLLSVTLVLPLAPFAYKLRPSRPFTFLILTIFLSTTIYALLSFPFSSHAPLKVFFQQRVEFPTLQAQYDPSNTLLRPKVFTAISGPGKYVLSDIVRSLPSAEGKEIGCTEEVGARVRQRGLVTCEWETGPRMWFSPGSYLPSPTDVRVYPVAGDFPSSSESSSYSYDKRGEWKQGEVLKAEVMRTGPASAVITVKGRNTRGCRLYFDSSPVYEYTIWPDGDGAGAGADHQQQRPYVVQSSTDMQDGYAIGPQGVDALRLWSRTWEREFKVAVRWDNNTDTSSTSTTMTGMEGRVACEWSEYESGLVDNGSMYEPFEARMPFASFSSSSLRGDGGVAKVKMLDEDRPRIPAFEEVLTFLPEWATVTKFSDGLVEAWVPFAV